MKSSFVIIAKILITLLITLFSYYLYWQGNGMYNIKELLSDDASSCARFNVHLVLSVGLAISVAYIVKKIWQANVLLSTLLSLTVLSIGFAATSFSLDKHNSISSFGYHTAACNGNQHLTPILSVLYVCMVIVVIYSIRAKLIFWRKKNAA